MNGHLFFAGGVFLVLKIIRHWIEGVFGFLGWDHWNKKGTPPCFPPKEIWRGVNNTVHSVIVERSRGVNNPLTRSYFLGGVGCFSFGVQTSGEYISTMFGCI